MRLKARTSCKPNCPRRSATCHAECPDYADYRRELEEEKKLQYRQNYADYYLLDRNRRIWRSANAKKNYRT